MTRLPIRLRLTLAFALAMAVVLAAVGAFLYFRLSTSLDEAIDENLQSRTAEISAQASSPGTIRAGGDPDEQFVQVLDSSGQVVEASFRLQSTSLLDPSTVSRIVAMGSESMEVDEVPGVSGRARILATPVLQSDGETLVVVAGTSLEDRDETVRGFLTELFIVGPAALVLASLLGYAIATAALRPVEAMRVEAGGISGAEPGRRLPLPEARDEVRRLGETLNEMLGRLETALERERAFVADAGHELRTPLALLKAELELALRRPRSQEELADAVRSAAHETERLAQLAEDLLLLARSDRAELPLRREEVAVAPLLHGVAERYGHRARAASRTIEVEAAEGIELDADPTRLEQALGNLVENALSHGLGAIQLSAVERNGQVELHVRDHGAGFPPEFLPSAFDRFSQADDARTGEGTGLGLTIASAIAAAHGGSAHAANLDGVGADVWLTLPRTESG